MRSGKVAQIGLDAHRTFSKGTVRNAEGRVVCRMWIDRRDRRLLREELGLWPKRTAAHRSGVVDAGAVGLRLP